MRSGTASARADTAQPRRPARESARTRAGGRLAIRLAAKLRVAGSDRSGVSAIEFGLIAPMIFFGMLSMIDVGRAINERMALDAALQAGAMVALSDPGAAAVRSAVLRIEEGRESPSGRGATTLTVERFYACPESPASPLNACTAPCAASCAGLTPAAIYYRLVAATRYSGALLPEIPLATDMRVRVR